MELDAEEARADLLKNGALAVPGVKTLEQASPQKVFSGKKEDGGIWIVRKNADGFFFVEYTVKNAPGWTA